MYNILLLEDNQTDADLIARELRKKWSDIVLTVVSRLEEARQFLHGSIDLDLAIFDLNLPDGNAMDLLIELRNQDNPIPIIILTGQGSEEIAAAALKAGANDYISKKPGFYKDMATQIEYTFTHIAEKRRHLSVLYVEHHQSDIDLSLRHFKKLSPHIHVKVISSGEKALELLPTKADEKCDFDVLLIDYQLPGLNALEICKIIRLERKLSVAIVIITGQGSEDIAVETLKIGADDYVVKRENYLMRLPSVLMSAFRRKELERKEIALSLSETKFRLLADYSSDWEYWINPQGEYVYISPACEQTSGYTSEAFLKDDQLFFELVHPDYQDLVIEHFRQKEKTFTNHLSFKLLTKVVNTNGLAICANPFTMKKINISAREE
ncbi:MAG: response regulator [Bacteroidetes bacterium]|jgi:PAS domain S-box-containing protein|nr:response regulator [Bacteroidota bacterium]MBT3748485.1 response regulator [Bacteroidota bacterium]MBT4399679.1 response regulator [Bacteroidota bacterium]MBT4409566.1 response regulator [Bacteroidota bacterium]MBT5426775.1 response regulator [Bacteroidota bacterium]